MYSPLLIEPISYNQQKGNKNIFNLMPDNFEEGPVRIIFPMCQNHKDVAEPVLNIWLFSADIQQLMINKLSCFS